MTAEVTQEIIYGAWCAECAWGEGDLTTSEDEAERLATEHDAQNHRPTESAS